MAVLFFMLVGHASHAVEASKTGLPHAWELDRIGEYDSALKIFQAVQKDPTATPAQKLEALFGEAHLWNFRADYPDKAKARTMYAEIVAKLPPGNPLADWSDFESVQSSHLETPHDSRDNAAIAKSYLDVYQRRPETPAGGEAFVTAMMLKQQVLKLPGADIIKECQTFLLAHPDSPWATNVYASEASCYEDLKQPRQAVECMISAAAAAQKAAPTLDIDNSTNFWQIGYMAEFELGDFKTAREYYGKLISDYPNDARVFPARQALARMDKVEAAVRAGHTVPSDPRKWSRPWIQL